MLGTTSRTPVHPGKHLAEELRELGVTAAESSRHELRLAENEVGAKIAMLPRRAGRPTSRKLGKTG